MHPVLGMLCCKINTSLANIPQNTAVLAIQLLQFKKNQGVFVKHYGMPPAATKSKKLFLVQRQIQGHKVIDLGVIWQGIISGVCMPNMKSLYLTVQNL